MKTGLKWVGISILSLGVAVVLLWAASRFWPLPVEQREAMRLLQAPLPTRGENGFTALWTLRYDGLEGAGGDAVMAQDVERWRTGSPGQRPVSSSAEGRFPATPLSAPAGCGRRGIGCLAAVRADPDGVEAAHAGHDALHQRVAALAGYGHFTSPFKRFDTDPMVPLPVFQPVLDPVSAHALAHVRGDSGTALAGACADILSGRRMTGQGDALITSMIGAAMVESNARLLADILVELPADTALPAICVAALAPMTADEQSLCTAMRGEFGLAGAGVRLTTGNPAAQYLLLDVPRTQARMAPRYAWACAASAELVATRDAPTPIPGPAQDRFACIANPLGCALSNITGPDMRQYAGRPQDAAAMLRLVAAQRWLRQQPTPASVALQRLPEALRSPTRTPVLSDDGHWLQVERRAVMSDVEATLRVPMRAPAH
ncbi:hypothetical protein [Stenotrophomonas rhizophila]|uniref:hypothetical protein n=1 Tax=Stenotrophomonas rhizophila TaxID=216778 RepID=UPI0011CE3520|nr:hypothetical protein [Stenotrophomonas rhizophila]